MPTETRVLVFDRDESGAAARDYAVRKEMVSKADRLLDLEVRPEPEDILVLRLADRDNCVRQVELSHVEVAVALILFCKQRRIPLPRRADKHLTRVGGGMALTIKLPFSRPLDPA